MHFHVYSLESDMCRLCKEIQCKSSTLIIPTLFFCSNACLTDLAGSGHVELESFLNREVQAT